MLLFVASTKLGYRIFTYANKKFANVFVRAFTKSGATGLHFHKSSYRLETFIHQQPDFLLFALALQIILF